MYQELEMYKTYKKEKAAKIQRNHEVIGNASAILVIAIVAIIVLTFVN